MQKSLKRFNKEEMKFLFKNDLLTAVFKSVLTLFFSIFLVLGFQQPVLGRDSESAVKELMSAVIAHKRAEKLLVPENLEKEKQKTKPFSAKGFLGREKKAALEKKAGVFPEWPKESEKRITALTKAIEKEELKEQKIVEPKTKKEVELIKNSATREFAQKNKANVFKALKRKKLESKELFKKISAENLKLLKSKAKKETCQKEILKAIKAIEEERQKSAITEREKILRIELLNVDADIENIDTRIFSLNNTIEELDKRSFNQQKQIAEEKEKSKVWFSEISIQEGKLKKEITSFKKDLAEEEFNEKKALVREGVQKPQFESLLAKRTNIQEKIARFKEEIEMKNALNLQKLQQKETFQKELEAIRAEQSDLKPEIQAGKNKIAGLEMNLSQIKGEVLKKKADINQKLSQLASQKQKAQKKLSLFTASLEKEKLLRSDAIARKAALTQKQIDLKNKKIDKLTWEFNRQKDHIQALSKDEDTAASGFLDVGVKIESIQKEIIQQEFLLEEALRVGCLVAKKHDALKNKFLVANTDLEAADQKISEISQLLEEETLANEISRKREALNLKFSALSVEKKSREKTIAMLKKSLLKAQDRQKRLALDKQVQYESLSKAAAEQKSLNQKIKKSKNILARQKADKQTFSKKKADINQKLSQLPSQRQEAKKKLSSLTVSLEKEKLLRSDAIVKKAALTQKQIDLKNKKIDKLTREFERQKDRLWALSKDEDTAASGFSDVGVKIESIQKEIISQQSLLEEALRASCLAAKKHDALKNKFFVANADLKASVQKISEISQLLKEEILANEISRKREALNLKFSTLLLEKKFRKNKITKLKVSLSEAQARKKRLALNKQAQYKSLSKAAAEQKSLNQRIKEGKNILARQKADKQNFLKKKADINQKLSHLASQKQEAKKKLSLLAVPMEKEKLLRIDAIDRKAALTQKQIDLKNKKINKLTREFERQKDHIQALSKDEDTAASGFLDAGLKIESIQKEIIQQEFLLGEALRASCLAAKKQDALKNKLLVVNTDLEASDQKISGINQLLKNEETEVNKVSEETRALNLKLSTLLLEKKSRKKKIITLKAYLSEAQARQKKLALDKQAQYESLPKAAAEQKTFEQRIEENENILVRQKINEQNFLGKKADINQKLSQLASQKQKAQKKLSLLTASLEKEKLLRTEVIAEETTCHNQLQEFALVQEAADREISQLSEDLAWKKKNEKAAIEQEKALQSEVYTVGTDREITSRQELLTLTNRKRAVQKEIVGVLSALTQKKQLKAQILAQRKSLFTELEIVQKQIDLRDKKIDKLTREFNRQKDHIQALSKDEDVTISDFLAVSLKIESIQKEIIQQQSLLEEVLEASCLAAKKHDVLKNKLLVANADLEASIQKISEINRLLKEEETEVNKAPEEEEAFNLKLSTLMLERKSRKKKIAKLKASLGKVQARQKKLALDKQAQHESLSKTAAEQKSLKQRIEKSKNILARQKAGKQNFLEKKADINQKLLQLASRKQEAQRKLSLLTVSLEKEKLLCSEAIAEEIALAQKRIDLKDKKIDKLTREFNRQKGHIQALSKDEDVAISDFLAVSLKIESIQKEIIQQESHLEEALRASYLAAKKQDALKNKLLVASTDLEASGQKISEINQLLKEEETEANKVSEEMEALNLKLSTLLLEKKSRKKKIAKLKVSLSKAQDRQKRVALDKQAQYESLSKADAEQKSRKQRIEESKNTLARQKAGKQNFLEKKADINQKLLQLASRKQEVQKKLSLLTVSLEKEKLLCSEAIAEEIALAQKRIDLKDKKIDKLTREFNRQKDRLWVLSKDEDTAASGFLDAGLKIESIQKEVIQQQSHLEEALRARCLTAKKHDALRNKLLVANADLEASAQKISEINQLLEEEEIEVNNVSEEMGALNSKFSNLLLERKSRKDTTARLKKSLLKAQNQQKKLALDKQAQYESLFKAAAEQKSLNQRIEESKNILSRQKINEQNFFEKKADINQRLFQLPSQKQEAQKKLSLLTVSLEKEKLLCAEAIAEEIALAQKQIDLTNKKIDKLTREFERQKDHIQALSKDEDITASGFSGADLKIESIQKEVIQQEFLLEEALRVSCWAAKKEDVLKNKLLVANADLETSNQKISEISQLLEKAEVQANKVSEEKGALDLKFSNLLLERKSRKKKIAKLKDSLNEAQAWQERVVLDKQAQYESLSKVATEQKSLDQRIEESKNILARQKAGKQNFLEKKADINQKLLQLASRKQEVQKKLSLLTVSLEKEKLLCAEAIAEGTTCHNQLQEFALVQEAADREISQLSEDLAWKKKNEKAAIEREKRTEMDLKMLTLQLEIIRKRKTALEKKRLKLQMSVFEKEKKEALKRRNAAEIIITKTNQQIDMLLSKKEEKIDRLRKEGIRKKKAEDGKGLQGLAYHYNLALCYDEASRIKEAVKGYKRALEIDPDDADTHYNLAIIYDDHLKDKKRAVEHYRRYLELCPGADDVEKVSNWIAWAEQSPEFKQ